VVPSKSSKQAAFMAAEYGKAKAGKPTRSGMGLAKLREWVHADVDKKKHALKGALSGRK
jgi:hypothetical protein